ASRCSPRPTPMADATTVPARTHADRESEPAVGELVSHLEIDDAWIVDPATGFEGVASLTVDDGVVVEGRRRADAKADRAVVGAPGSMDLHVHVREPQSNEAEDFASVLAAAAHGGYTWIGVMPDLRTTVDRTEVVQRVRAAAAAAPVPVQTALFAALTT